LQRQNSERAAVFVILAASLILYLTYSAITPLFEASDELWHYPMVQTLATGNGLPVQRKDATDAEAPWRQEGSQPPLYYAIAALVSSPADSSNWREIRRLNVHAYMGVPAPDGNANGILHTPEEKFPWSGAALSAHLARAVSAVMSAVTILFVYLIACELFPDGEMSRRVLRLSTTLIAAFTPMFAFISGAINNDNAAVMFSTMGLWWALRLMRRGDLSLRSAVIAGVIAGCGALSKVSALGLMGLFGVAALLATQRPERVPTNWADRSGRFGRLIRFGLIMLALAALIAGWWYVRNQVLYGDLLGWNAFLDAVGRRVPIASLAQLWSEREGFAWAYWGVFGALNVIFPPIVYHLLNAIAAIAFVATAFGFLSLAKAQIRKGKWLGVFASLREIQIQQIILCVFWVVILFIGLLRWSALTPASQGRLMFPAIAVISAALAYGLWRIHRLVLMAFVAGFVLLGIATPFWVIGPAYAAPANIWQMRLPQPVNLTFGDSIQLIEADPPAGPIHPGEEAMLTLNWKMTKPVPKNYSVFVHLVDENDVIVAQRDMYPGQGNMALAELPSPYVWTDHYALRISTRELAPRQLRWRVGVYDAQTGQRVLPDNGKEFAEFGALALQPAPPGVMLNFANGAQLIGYDLSPRTAAHGEAITMTLSLREAKKLDGSYNVSVQLLDDNARKAAQQDFALNFVDGAANETRVLSIAKDAPPGVYRLLIVIYQPRDPFPKVGAYDSREEFVGDQIELTRVRVK